LWSLAIEEQFYIIWPLALWLAFKLKVSRKALTYWLCAGIALSFAANIGTVQTDATTTFYSPLTRAWELLIGALLAVHALPKPTPTQANRLAVLGLAMMGAALVLLDKTKAFPGWWALLPTLGTALLLHAGSAAHLSQTLLANKAMVAVGLISYPLYLWHWPIFSFARIITGAELTISTALACIAAALALAFLTVRYWERLLRHLGSKTAIGLLCAMLLVGYAGWNVHVREGLDSRYKKTLTYSDALKRDFASWESKGMYPTGNCSPSFDYPKATICAVSSTAKPADTAVFGDSHAFHTYWGLTKTAKGASSS
jgi:peptidoglycan/LPS O-acetylase OafA/YrhL